MRDIIITTHDRLDNETALTDNRTPDGHVPGGVAGYLIGECTVLCPECASDDDRVTSHGDDTEAHEYTYDYIGGMSEWDYPGAVCDVCHTYLDTNILVYEGSEIYDQLEE